jgi:hypothetical protein
MGEILEEYVQSIMDTLIYINRGNVWSIVSRPIPALLFTVALGVILILFLLRLIKRAK